MTRCKNFVSIAFLAASFLIIFAAAAQAQQQMPADMAAAASTKIEPALQESPEKPAAAIIDVEPVAAAAVTAASAERKPVSVSGMSAIEWEFLKTYGENKDEDVLEAVLPQLSAWLRTYPDSEFADKALLLKANLNLKLGDYRCAILNLIKLQQEYPDSDSSAAAGQLLSITADKKLNKKEKAILMEIAKAPGVSGKADRLAFVLGEMSVKFGQDFYEPLTAEFTEFFGRFPAYAGRDWLQLALGMLYSQKKEYVLARLAYEKLILVYPESAHIARAKRLLGDVLAENLKDYLAAIKVYRDITEKYPGTPEAWAAYIQLPRLTERQKQYALAVEVYENIIKLYPDKPEARDAFKSEARILREEMSKPAEAIAVLNRLADTYKDEKVVEELYLAAEIARKDVKDLDAEIKMYDRIAADYNASKEAPKALLAAGQAFEKAKNLDKAKEYYEKIVKNYPEGATAKKAQKYMDALTPKV